MKLQERIQSGQGRDRSRPSTGERARRVGSPNNLSQIRIGKVLYRFTSDNEPVDDCRQECISCPGCLNHIDRISG